MNSKIEELELLSAYIDGELDKDEQDKINTFLAHSVEGRQNLEKILHTKSIMISAPPIQAPEDLLNELENLAYEKMEKMSAGRKWQWPWSFAPQNLIWATSCAGLILMVSIWAGGNRPGNIPLETLMAAHARAGGITMHDQLLQASHDSLQGESHVQ